MRWLCTLHQVWHIVPRWTGVVFTCMHNDAISFHVAGSHIYRTVNTVEPNAKWCEVTLGAPSAPASEAWRHPDSSEVYGGGLGWKRWMAQWNGVVSWNETMHRKSGVPVCPWRSPKLQYWAVLKTFGNRIDLHLLLYAKALLKRGHLDW